MASPSATVLSTPSSFGQLHITVLFLAALVALPPTLSSLSGAVPEPTLTFCSGQSPYFTSSPVISSSELANFLGAVCAGAAYGAAGMSHNMSSRVAGNRTIYGVAQCRPDVPVGDCAACLAASSRLIAGTAPCAASAVWRDSCFLRYSEWDPAGGFREDEYTATVFTATRRALSSSQSHEGGGRAAVTGLLAAAGNSTMRSHTCSGVGAGRTAAAGHGGLVYGLTRCAAGVACADCGRCLRGALAVVEREYNGSAGMQVLRLSCMARYESYPFFNATSPRLQGAYRIPGDSIITHAPVAAHPAPAPHGNGRSIITNATVTGNFRPAAHPAAAPPGGHTPQAQHPAVTLQPSLAQTQFTQPSHRMTRRQELIMLIVSIATGVVVVVVILVLIWYRRKQPVQMGHVLDGMGVEMMYDQGQEHLSTEEEDDEGERTSCQHYSYQVLEGATCHFSNSNKLGSGGFGTVYRGTLENGKEVAVKRLRDSKSNIQELEREISIVADLRHKNLVRFLGYCFEEQGRFLVYEYVPNNSLANFWYKASFQPLKLDWDTWFNIIKGVARGLRFLHDKGVIHRDLKPHNVLLDENFNPKIADFDLIRVYDKQKTHESTEKVAGTFGYMAPECTSGRKFQLSIKSDVYSYGVLVLEIITGHKIYTFEGQNYEGLVEYVWQHWTEKKASDVVDGDLLGVEGQAPAQAQARRQALRCVHVALLCVQSDRSRRPAMGQVIAMLSRDGTELQEPSLPGYVVRPAAAPGALLPCLGCR